MLFCFCFFFNDTATTEIYTYWHTLSLHDALPIARRARGRRRRPSSSARIRAPSCRRTPSAPTAVSCSTATKGVFTCPRPPSTSSPRTPTRSEEHTSELQSLMRISYAVFCLKKKKKNKLIKKCNKHK